ncbi:MAG: hypothetical protein M3Q76_04100, partial [Acidobacteriota bacterium]|nr:hypothetical protein [Acidobacteriota bacterium]
MKQEQNPRDELHALIGDVLENVSYLRELGVTHLEAPDENLVAPVVETGSISHQSQDRMLPTPE